MNMPGEHLVFAFSHRGAFGSPFLWRVSEAVDAWKGDLLSATRRESPMPFRFVQPSVNGVTRSAVRDEARRRFIDDETRRASVVAEGRRILVERG
jgi:hypothetical protein